jgi:hypothetical protein
MKRTLLAFGLALVLLTGVIALAQAQEGPVDQTLGIPNPPSYPAVDVVPGSAPLAGGGVQLILDDFNRADGPIGPDWTVHDGYFNVVNNAAQGGSFARATFIGAPGDGNAAEADIEVVGTSLQYTGLLLNYGAGNTNLFLKVQQQGASGNFEYGACYTGNNGGAFGLGFFPLDQQFATAHMAATRVGSTVTIEFTNVDGGTKPDQTYVCTGAPAPEGTGIGILGYGGIARLDNFGLPGAAELHVGGIKGHFVGNQLRANVLVLDQTDAPVAGVDVLAKFIAPGWPRPYQGIKTTNAYGMARFPWSSPLSGDWKICVEDLAKSGYTYDPGSNVITCKEWFH